MRLEDMTKEEIISLYKSEHEIYKTDRIIMNAMTLGGLLTFAMVIAILLVRNLIY